MTLNHQRDQHHFPKALGLDIERNKGRRLDKARHCTMNNALNIYKRGGGGRYRSFDLKVWIFDAETL